MHTSDIKYKLLSVDNKSMKYRLLRDWAKHRQIEFDLTASRKPSQQHVYDWWISPLKPMHIKHYTEQLLAQYYNLHTIEELEEAVRSYQPDYRSPYAK